ncbi:SDR family oxidoreductase [Streptomyces sp. NEAU-YJ-81]|uniref:SDR family oxidoreductase n=1 Tax=Streptomyces sp. NEAU-YJ-81 TaxID=2820288 RepID=UPI001ABC89A7|nr:SDR family oxidoreductase [Streptomyces sp. NEAU-YJ-81]MBO3679187.1 SDR family oxidoreductase [Streptomyces sp. NEAU-YJ-81]
MKIVVIGGTGLIGSKLVGKLNAHGHEAVAAAPNTGVNTLTGEGLAEVLEGASVVVDVSNSPSFEDEAVMDFFRTSTTNLLEAEAQAGVGHHVVLSVVGTDRLQDSGYFRAKQVQEDLIKASGIPYSIVHATQFFEFMKRLTDSATEGDTVHLAHVKIRPVYSDDLAAAVDRAALGTPTNDMVEVAGPDEFELDQLIRELLAAGNDPRKVVADPGAKYFDAELQETSLLPGPDAEITETKFNDWLVQQR